MTSKEELCRVIRGRTGLDDIQWERLRVKDLERIVSVLEDPRPFAIRFAADRAKKRVIETIDRTTEQLLGEG